MQEANTETTRVPFHPLFDRERKGALLDWTPRREDPRAAGAASGRSATTEDIWISPTWWP